MTNMTRINHRDLKEGINQWEGWNCCQYAINFLRERLNVLGHYSIKKYVVKKQKIVSIAQKGNILVFSRE